MNELRAYKDVSQTNANPIERRRSEGAKGGYNSIIDLCERIVFRYAFGTISRPFATTAENPPRETRYDLLWTRQRRAGCAVGRVADANVGLKLTDEGKKKKFTEQKEDEILSEQNTVRRESDLRLILPETTARTVYHACEFDPFHAIP